MRSNKLEIKNTTRGRTPRLPFERIATSILGSRYELSLVLCGDSMARRINSTYRHKGYAANVLSFPLEKHAGEIFLNLAAAKREAKQYKVTYAARLVLLFSHGCLHLKGMRHGRAMERVEEQMVRKFA